MKTKQEWLDIELPSNSEWVIQQLLIHCSKTELQQITRVLNRVDKLLYKTWAKQTQFDTLHGCVLIATKTMTDESGQNNLED